MCLEGRYGIDLAAWYVNELNPMVSFMTKYTSFVHQKENDPEFIH